MKKIVLLFAAFIFAAVTANTYAQSSGTAPAPGATHTYSITPGDSNNEIQWTVYNADFSTEATVATVSAPNSASTTITWASSVTPGDWYYVQVVETDSESCSNTKVLPVQITESNFYLELDAANSTACYDNAVSVSIVDNAPVYDHGNATLVFTVTPENLSGNYTGYSFDLAIDVPDGFDATPSFSSNASMTASTVTVTDNNAVTITYTVDNTNSYYNDSAANAQDYTATVSISNGVSINGVSENDTDNDNSDFTEVSRPNTSGITTD